MAYKHPNLHRKGKSLYFVTTENGRRKWIKVGSTDDETSALETYRLLKTASDIKNPGTIAGMAEVFRAKLIDASNPMGLAERTRKEYLRQLQPTGYLLKAFGAMPPELVKPSHIGIYLEKRSSSVSANREIALLSRMYSDRITRGEDLANPCLNIKRNREGSRTRYVEHWEFSGVRSVMPTPCQIAMDVAYLTGLRLSDVLRVRLEHYDNEFLRVTEAKTGTKARIVMTDSLMAALNQHEKLPGRGREFIAVVRNKHGEPYTLDSFQSAWQRGMKRALDQRAVFERFTFHDIRAKHATDKDEEALNAQHALGHSDPATTRKYLRHALGRKVEPLDKLPGLKIVEGA